jgi:hypothetical protein
MTRKTFLLLPAAAIRAATSANAPVEKPNFSGRWKADMGRSDFASLPQPRSFVRTIDQDPLHLTITVEALDEQGRKITGELRFALDGEESVNDVDGVRVDGFARRLGRHILMHTSRTVQGTKFEIDELWSLSGDGQTMTIEGAVITDLGEEDVFAVLNKEH